MVQGRKCDKYDYLIAGFSGAVAGLIDSVFVGAPNESILGKWTDASTDAVIRKMAKMHGWKPQSTNTDDINHAIKYFEANYPVNYDQAYGKAVSNLLDMNSRNHHIKSLAHAPDVFGLVFSVLDQFANTSHFLDNGRLIVFDTENSTLQGYSNPIAKIFAGICNWFWHTISDFAGSGGRTNRGSGVPIPFFEMFQLCDFGELALEKSTGMDTMTLADFSVKVFEEGYDARFGITMAIPVLLSDIMIKFLWGVKQRFYHQQEWKNCIPKKEHSELRWMLIIGNATLCIIDGADAVIRSSGNWLKFFLHCNIIAWFKLLTRVVKEIQFCFGFSYEDIKLQFEYLNVQMQEYLDKLRTVDYSGYQKQLKELDEIAFLLERNVEEANERMGEYINLNHIETDFQDFDGLLDSINDPDGVIKW